MVEKIRELRVAGHTWVDSEELRDTCDKALSAEAEAWEALDEWGKVNAKLGKSEEEIAARCKELAGQSKDALQGDRRILELSLEIFELQYCPAHQELKSVITMMEREDSAKQGRKGASDDS